MNISVNAGVSSIVRRIGLFAAMFGLKYDSNYSIV